MSIVIGRLQRHTRCVVGFGRCVVVCLTKQLPHHTMGQCQSGVRRDDPCQDIFRRGTILFVIVQDKNVCSTKKGGQVRRIYAQHLVVRQEGLGIVGQRGVYVATNHLQPHVCRGRGRRQGGAGLSRGIQNTQRFLLPTSSQHRRNMVTQRCAVVWLVTRQMTEELKGTCSSGPF